MNRTTQSRVLCLILFVFLFGCNGGGPIRPTLGTNTSIFYNIPSGGIIKGELNEPFSANTIFYASENEYITSIVFSNGYLYGIASEEDNYFFRRLFRMKTDGTSPLEYLYTDSIFIGNVMSVAIYGDRLYFSAFSRLYETNIECSETPKELFFASEMGNGGVQLIVDGNSVYWCSSFDIYTSNLNGSGIKLFSQGTDQSYDLRYIKNLVLHNGILYVNESEKGSIFTINPKFDQKARLLFKPNNSLDKASGFGIEKASGKLYWYNCCPKSVISRLDLSNLDDREYAIYETGITQGIVFGY